MRNSPPRLSASGTAGCAAAPAVVPPPPLVPAAGGASAPLQAPASSPNAASAPTHLACQCLRRILASSPSGDRERLLPDAASPAARRLTAVLALASSPVRPACK